MTSWACEARSSVKLGAAVEELGLAVKELGRPLIKLGMVTCDLPIQEGEQVLESRLKMRPQCLRVGWPAL